MLIKPSNATRPSITDVGVSPELRSRYTAKRKTARRGSNAGRLALSSSKRGEATSGPRDQQ